MKKIKLFIGVSGKISSGKSTIAHFIADKYKIPYVSSGDFLRKYCASNNLPADRISLQDLGQKFVDKDPQLFFQNIAFSQGEQDYIIFDSIRHLAGIDFIKEISEKSILIYMDVEDKILYDRYYQRHKEGDEVKSFEEFLKVNHHGTEKEIEEVKKYADITIRPEDNYEKILTEYLNKFI